MKNQMLFLCMLAGLTACTKHAPVTPDAKADDQWIYRYTNYNESGNITDTADIPYMAAGHSDDGFVTIQRTDIQSSNTPIIPYGDFRMEADGLHYISGNNIGTASFLFLEYPGAPGDAFDIDNINNLHRQGNIISTTDTLTVPYGFQSNLYHYTLNIGGDPADHLWFSDSLWFVKYEAWDSLSNDTGIYLDYVYELVNYTVH